MGKSWDQFWHFDEAAYAQDVAKLTPQQLTELHGTIRRKVISTTTSAGFGVVSAGATGGLSLIASGVSGRQRTVNGRRLKIIEDRITQVDADRYKTRKRDYIIPLGVGTAGIGLATGLEDTFYDELGSTEAVYAAKVATEVGVEHAYEAAEKHAKSTPDTVKANGTLVQPTYTAVPALQTHVPFDPAGVPSVMAAPNASALHPSLKPSPPSFNPALYSGAPPIVQHTSHSPSLSLSGPTFQPVGPPPQPRRPSCSSQPYVPVPTQPSLNIYSPYPSRIEATKQVTSGGSNLLQPLPPPQPPRPSSALSNSVPPQYGTPELPPRPSSALANKIPPPPSAPPPTTLPPPPPPKELIYITDPVEKKIPSTPAQDDLINKLVDDIESYLTLHTESPPPSYDSAIGDSGKIVVLDAPYDSAVGDSDKIVVVDAPDRFDTANAAGGNIAMPDTKRHSIAVNEPSALATYNPSTYALPSGAADEKLRIQAYNPAQYQPLGRSTNNGMPAIPAYNPAAWS